MIALMDKKLVSLDISKDLISVIIHYVLENCKIEFFARFTITKSLSSTEKSRTIVVYLNNTFLTCYTGV